jgi:hypothetical protein
MLEKTIGMMQHVWLRGALLIVKKFKVMRPKEQLQKLNSTVKQDREEPINTEHALPIWTYKGL